MQSQVLFLANRFAVMMQAGGTPTIVFTTQNGQLIIRDAVIGEGTIGNTKIGNYIQSSTWMGLECRMAHQQVWLRDVQ